MTMDRSRPSSSMSNFTLCNDIIVEILSWLPVDSLLRFKYVSKSWFNLIINPKFAKLHIDHHHSLAISPGVTQILNPSIMLVAGDNYCITTSMDEVSALLSASTIDKVNSLGFPKHFVKIVGSCNGLICVRVYNSDTYGDDILYLWNPSIKELKQIPSNKNGDDVSSRESLLEESWYGFGYDHVVDDYKVIESVRCFKNDELPNGNDNNNILMDVFCEPEVKVFTLGTNSWRRIQGVPYKHEFSYSFCSNDTTWKYVSGAFHRIARLPSSPNRRILSFDIVDEVYREVPVNLECFDSRFICELTVLRGCLCVSAYDNSFADRYYMEIWMMMNYGVKESWTKLFSITNVVDFYRLMPENRLNPVWFCKDDEVVMVSGSELLVYDPKHGQVKLSKLYTRLRFQTEVYIGSLVSLKSQQRNREKQRIC